MYTPRKVRRAVQDMSDDDFTILLDEFDSEARAVVVDDAGRTNQAEALVRHFEETRSLGALVDIIRVVTPNATF